ncbi:tumor necrosis factor ligand superfamily member 15-like [Amblyraja radiata]|uniref:tumor necrosis factor ligand superfamily member 15-like n=1 Tax=Amblyraja radiata TaxID=386614 RepID=UPI00140322B5|nr:tumor necrosis factor ligand superfamily member 15-like [Amblyraja radiata]
MRIMFQMLSSCGTAGMDTPLNQDRLRRRVRANYLKPSLLGCILVMIVTSVQVAAASYVSYYVLKGQLQRGADGQTAKVLATRPTQDVNKCITRWTSALLKDQETRGEEAVLAWETKVGLAFTGDCTAYNEKSLEIKKPGIYFIYFQVMFHESGSNVTFVMDFNGVKIVQNSQQVLEKGKAVFFGSAYKLNEGTKIFVKSNPKHILLRDSETFIGLFEL